MIGATSPFGTPSATGFPLIRKQISSVSVWLLVFVFVGTVARAGDGPRFRGPDADGLSTETGLFTKEVALSLAWKQPLGSGYSGIAVAKGTLVTMFADGASDWTGAFDTRSGNEKWRYDMGA
jgi:hypothetical protein